RTPGRHPPPYPSQARFGGHPWGRFSNPGRRRLPIPPGRGHRVAPIAAAMVAVAMFIAPTGSAEPIPSVRLFAASTHLRVQSGGNDVVRVDPGIYITPTGNDFELHVSRSNYDTPFAFEQVDPDTGTIL